MSQQQSNPEVISFLTLRRTIGILGMALPLILLFGPMIACGCTNIQISISNYYHTCMRNIFVGVMCAFSFFLFAYKGYEKHDNILAYLGSFFALCVAILPTEFKNLACNFTPNIEYNWVGYAHLIAALLFFAVLIYFSLVLFVKTNPDSTEITPQKKKRNLVYRICGSVMVACILITVIYVAFFRKNHPQPDNWHMVFWLETVSLWAFGISWLTKGKVLWPD